MRELRYVATPNLQGAYVTVSDQVHVLLRMKGLRPVSRPAIHAQDEALLSAPAKEGFAPRPSVTTH